MVKCKKALETLAPYAPGKPIEEVKRELGLENVIKLASNENPYGAPPCAVEAAKSALEDVFYYPDGSCYELKAALSKKLGVSESTLTIGAGADELISILCETFLEPGDEAVTGELTFGQYAASVIASGCHLKTAPMKDDSFDLNALASCISPHTKIIFIANPNNPTGTIITDSDKIAFLERVPKNVLVVFDEAYQEYVESKEYSSSVPLVEKYENLAVLKTFSKVYGLASLRVGYGIMRSELALGMEKIRKPFNVSMPAQKAALAALSDEAHVLNSISKNKEVKRYCYKKLDELGLTYVKTETNFIAIDSPIDSLEAFDSLLKKGYIVRPNAFGMKGRLRVTFGTMEQMQGFFTAFKEIISK